MSIRWRGGGRRLSARTITADYLAGAPSLVTLTAGLIAYIALDEPWLGKFALWGFIALLGFFVAQPVVRWLSTYVLITDEDATVVTGIVMHRLRTITWRNAHVIDVERSMSYRLLGLHRVALRAGGDEASEVVIDGADDRLLVDMRGYASSAAGTLSVGRAPSGIHPAQPSPDTLIYAAGVGQLAFAGVIYGQFAVIGGAVVMGIVEALQALGFLEMILPLLLRSPAIGVGALVVIMLASGSVASACRFHGLRLQQSQGGNLRVQYGVLHKRDRTIRPESLVGVRIQQNLIEAVIGRARMSLLSIDSSQQVGTNLVLPSLPRHLVVSIASEQLRRVGVEWSDPTPSRRSDALLAASVIVPLTVGATICAMMLRSGTHIITSGAAGMTGVGLALAVFWATTARIRITHGGVSRSHVVMRRRVDIVRGNAIQVVSRLILGGRSIMSLHAYAGGTLSLRAAGVTECDVQRLRSIVRTRPHTHTPLTEGISYERA